MICISVPPQRRFIPLSSLGVISMILNAACSLLNLMRGMYIINDGQYDVSCISTQARSQRPPSRGAEEIQRGA